jgi:hypothetical protein
MVRLQERIAGANATFSILMPGPLMTVGGRNARREGFDARAAWVRTPRRSSAASSAVRADEYTVPGRTVPPQCANDHLGKHQGVALFVPWSRELGPDGQGVIYSLNFNWARYL